MMLAAMSLSLGVSVLAGVPEVYPDRMITPDAPYAEGELFGDSYIVGLLDGKLLTQWRSPFDSEGQPEPAMLVFDVATGTQLARCEAPTNPEGEHFGVSATIIGDRIYVASPIEFHTDGGVGKLYPGRGRIYMYDVATSELVDTFEDQSPDAYFDIGFGLRTNGTHLVAFFSTIVEDGTLLSASPYLDFDQRGGVAIMDPIDGTIISTILSDDVFGPIGFGYPFTIAGDRLFARADNGDWPDVMHATECYDISDPTNPVRLWREDNISGLDDFADDQYVTTVQTHEVVPGRDILLDHPIVHVHNALDGSLIASHEIQEIGRSWVGPLEAAVDGDVFYISDANQYSDTSRVLVFHAISGELIEVLRPPLPLEDEYFGSQIYAENGTVAVSSSLPSETASRGTIYVFDRTQRRCAQDLNTDGQADFFDISAMLTSRIDYNADTQFDFFDISAFLQDLSAGCP
jgi:hypothetical protein